MEGDKLFVSRTSQAVRRDFKSFNKTVQSMFGRETVYYYDSKRDEGNKAVHVDDYLARWGLRSKSKGQMFYQEFVCLFSLVMMIRWILIISVHIFDLNKYYSEILCDFTRYVPGYTGKLFYHINILFASFVSFSWTLFCWNIRGNNKYFIWIKLFDMTKGKKHAKELYLTEYMANAVWRETNWTITSIYTIIRNVTMIAATSGCIYANWNELRQGHLSAIIWTPLQAIWVYYMSTHCLGPVAVFRCICFYFDIRLRKLVEDAQIISKHADHLSIEDFSEIVYNFLLEFDRTLVDMDKYNLFWQFFILVAYGPGFLLLFFGATVVGVFSSQVSTVHWIIQLASLALNASLWVYSVLLAGHVASNGKRLYSIMNRVCLTRIEPEISLKLENMIKRFSARQIGFHCYHMFTVTYEFLYEVLLFTGTSYVLVIDSIIV